MIEPDSFRVGLTGDAPSDSSFQQLPFIRRQNISPILFGFLALLLIFLLYQIVGGAAAFVFFGLKPTAGHVAGFRIVTGLSQVFLILIPTVILVRLTTTTPARFLRLSFPHPRVFLMPVIGIFSLQQMLQIYLVLQEKIPLPERLLPIINQLRESIEEAYRQIVSSSSVPELLFVVLVIALIPAFVEELLFRGLVQRSFENGLGPMKGAVLTGIIFGAYHLNPFAFIPLAALGIYLGFLTMRANSIWVSVVVHFFNNATASLAMYLHYDDDAIVTGNPNTMSGGNLLLSFVVFGSLFVATTVLFVRATEKEKKNIDLSASDFQPTITN